MLLVDCCGDVRSANFEGSRRFLVTGRIMFHHQLPGARRDGRGQGLWLQRRVVEAEAILQLLDIARYPDVWLLLREPIL